MPCRSIGPKGLECCAFEAFHRHAGLDEHGLGHQCLFLTAGIEMDGHRE
jgi:hypothetical protein